MIYTEITPELDHKFEIVPGIQLTVPVCFRYLTTDEDGTIVGHVSRPHLLNTMWMSEGSRLVVGHCKYEGDWRNSLINIFGDRNV